MANEHSQTLEEPLGEESRKLPSSDLNKDEPERGRAGSSQTQEIIS